jgi:anti-sigma-K factor RskA
MTIATVAIAIFTAGAVIVGVRAYEDAAEMNYRTTAAQSHAVAVSILQDYMKLAVEHPELASKYEKHPTTDRREWFASHAYSSAEAIYNLTHGEAPWDSTVAGMIDAHALLVTGGEYYCHDYTAAFDSLVQKVLQNRYRCAK